MKCLRIRDFHINLHHQNRSGMAVPHQFDPLQYIPPNRVFFFFHFWSFLAFWGHFARRTGHFTRILRTSCAHSRRSQAVNHPKTGLNHLRYPHTHQIWRFRTNLTPYSILPKSSFLTIFRPFWPISAILAILPDFAPFWAQKVVVTDPTFSNPQNHPCEGRT